MYMKRCVNCMEEIQGPECPYCGFDENLEKQDTSVLRWNTILHGRYLAGRTLGQNGFCVTYMGYDLILNIKVTIKEYFLAGCASRNMESSNELQWNPSQDGQDSWKDGCENFIKEAGKMAQIDTVPEIVRVRDTFFENRTAYIVMDFVEGITMKAQLQKDGPMNVKECLALLKPLMEGLAEIHKQGMVHGAISPDNLMILPDKTVRLLDFGVAKEMAADGNIGPWTDVYAFTEIIYYAVTGEMPPQIIERVKADHLKLKPNPSKGLTREVMKVFRDGMAVREQERIQTMTELLKRFEEAVQKRQTAAGKITKAAAAGLAAAGVMLIAVTVWGIKGSSGASQIKETVPGTVSGTAAETAAETAAGTSAGTEYFQEQNAIPTPDSILNNVEYYGKSARGTGYLYLLHEDQQEVIVDKLNVYNKALEKNGITVDTSEETESILAFYDGDRIVAGKNEFSAIKREGETIGGLACAVSENVGGVLLEFVFTDDLNEFSMDQIQYFEEDGLMALPDSLVDNITLEEAGGSVAEPCYRYALSGDRKDIMFYMYIQQLEILGLTVTDLQDNQYTVEDGGILYQISYTPDTEFTVSYERTPEVWEEVIADGSTKKSYGFKIDGKMEGFGQSDYGWMTLTAEFENGSVKGIGIWDEEGVGLYEGEIESGFQGYGSFSMVGGSYYEGQWEDGWQQGLGMCKWTNGNIYVGEWQAGDRSGIGRYSFNNENPYYYLGEFKNGNPEGVGFYVDGAGRTTAGLWSGGYFQGEADQESLDRVEKETKDMLSRWEELQATKGAQVAEQVNTIKQEYERLKEKYPDVFPQE